MPAFPRAQEKEKNEGINMDGAEEAVGVGLIGTGIAEVDNVVKRIKKKPKKKAKA